MQKMQTKSSGIQIRISCFFLGATILFYTSAHNVLLINTIDFPLHSHKYVTTPIFIKLIVAFLLQFWASIPIVLWDLLPHGPTPKMVAPRKKQEILICIPDDRNSSPDTGDMVATQTFAKFSTTYDMIHSVRLVLRTCPWFYLSLKYIAYMRSTPLNWGCCFGHLVYK
jgi:hypothetical protein